MKSFGRDHGRWKFKLLIKELLSILTPMHSLCERGNQISLFIFIYIIIFLISILILSKFIMSYKRAQVNEHVVLSKSEGQVKSKHEQIRQYKTSIGNNTELSDAFGFLTNEEAVVVNPFPTPPICDNFVVVH